MANDLINPAVDSSSMILFDDWMSFNPFACSSFDEALQNLWQMVRSINRASIYYAYTFGKFVDLAQLKRKYGIETVAQLAEQVGVSANTLARYRSIYTLLTEHEVRNIADRGISINAILVIANAKKEHPEEAQMILETLLRGTDFTEKEAKSELMRLVLENARPYKLLPGGEPPADGVVEKSLQDLTADTDPTSPADRILDAEVVSDDEDEDDEYSDCVEKTLNKHDIKVVSDATLHNLMALRRELSSVIENIEAEIEVVHEKESIIIGDAEVYDHFQEKVSELYGLTKAAAETLIRVFVEGKKFNYVHPHAKLVVPQSTILEEVFRTED